MRGRPAVYATFSSYDEVAHHSGLERADTLEALRKLDEQFGRIDRARRYAARPYEIVVLSDHGQTQGATFKQRNGYGARRARRAVARSGTVTDVARRRRATSMVGHAVGEATGAARKKRAEERRLRPQRRRARLGQPRARLPDGGAAPADARGDRRAPSAADAGATDHPHIGLLLVRSAERGAVVLGAAAARVTWQTSRSSARIPLAPFSPTRRAHLRRTDGFEHVADIMVNSFYDPAARRRLRLRGADLVPRRARRTADAGRSSSTRSPCRCPASRSSAPQPSTTLLSGWRRFLEGDREASRAEPSHQAV